MRSVLIRAGRTFAQAFLGVYLLATVGATRFERLVDVGLLESAAVAGWVAGFTALQNGLEWIELINLGPRD